MWCVVMGFCVWCFAERQDGRRGKCSGERFREKVRGQGHTPESAPPTKRQ